MKVFAAAPTLRAGTPTLLASKQSHASVSFVPVASRLPPVPIKPKIAGI